MQSIFMWNVFVDVLTLRSFRRKKKIYIYIYICIKMAIDYAWVMHRKILCAALHHA